MSDRPAVTISGVTIRVWPWSSWRDAVTAADAAAAAGLRTGECWVVDARGEIVDPDGAVVDGAAIELRRAD